MGYCEAGSWEKDILEEGFANSPLLAPMGSLLPDDEFAPGAPPPLNEWVGEGLGKRAIAGAAGQGVIENDCGVLVGGIVDGGEAVDGVVVGGKRSFVAPPEVEEAKKRRVNLNTERRAEMGMKRLRAHLRNAGVAEEDALKFWRLESSGLCNCICGWIYRMRRVGDSDLSPRAVISHFNGLRRHLAKVADLNLREALPHKVDCLSVLDNKIRKLQEEGAVAGQRACMTRRDCELLCELRREKEGPLFHFCRLFLAALPLIGNRGEEGLRRVRIADFKRGARDGANLLWRAETFGKGSKAQAGGAKFANAHARSAPLFEGKSLGACCPRSGLDEHLQLRSSAPLPGNPFFRGINHQAKRKAKRCARRPMGVGPLNAAMKKLRRNAGLGRKGRANHSLRSRMIARLGEAGRSSERISKRSGRRSSDGLKQCMNKSFDGDIAQQMALAKGKESAKSKLAGGSGVVGKEEKRELVDGEGASESCGLVGGDSGSAVKGGDGGVKLGARYTGTERPCHAINAAGGVATITMNGR